jgi:hypothetical protein
MPDLPPEFVVFLIFGGGLLVLCPLFYQAGKQAGLAEAPRRIVQLAPIYAQQTAPAPVELVRTEARTFTRLRWGDLNRTQWRALWVTTATAELAGDGKPFSRSELEQVRDLMVRRGVAYWKNPAAHSQGWTIRPHMLDAIAEHVGAVVRRGERQ